MLITVGTIFFGDQNSLIVRSTTLPIFFHNLMRNTLLTYASLDSIRLLLNSTHNFSQHRLKKSSCQALNLRKPFSRHLLKLSNNHFLLQVLCFLFSSQPVAFHNRLTRKISSYAYYGFLNQQTKTIPLKDFIVLFPITASLTY